MWHPDGWNSRIRIGILTPHGDVGPEAEFQAMAAGRLSIHAARVPLGAYAAAGGTLDRPVGRDIASAFAEPPLVDDAVGLLAAAPLSAIAYAFTSGSYARGAADDAALKARLEQRTHGIPVVITCASATIALDVLGARRLALFNPPWFSVESDELGAAYFRKHGCEVVYHGLAGLPVDQNVVEPQELYDWVRAHTPDSADAIFIGGNGLRAVGVIEALEAALGRPVLTANQVAFWHALQLAGANLPIKSYGRIFNQTVLA